MKEPESMGEYLALSTEKKMALDPSWCPSCHAIGGVHDELCEQNEYLKTGKKIMDFVEARTKIKGCPMCGEPGKVERNTLEYDGVKIKCFNCGTQGGIRATYKTAVEAWNKRV